MSEHPSFHLVELRRDDESVDAQQERNLIVSAQQGNTYAFQQLYERYRDRVYTVIYYNLNDLQLAEDVAQNVFVKAFEALPSFRMESTFLTWIYTIAINECKNRKRQRRFFITWDKKLDDTIDPAGSPDTLHVSQEMNVLVRRAVMELSPKLRSVVVLKYLEELSYDEIASVLGCSPGTVASRLNRALIALESRLRRLKS